MVFRWCVQCMIVFRPSLLYFGVCVYTFCRIYKRYGNVGCCCRMGVLYNWESKSNRARFHREMLKSNWLLLALLLCVFYSSPAVVLIYKRSARDIATDISSILVDDIVCRSVVIRIVKSLLPIEYIYTHDIIIMIVIIPVWFDSELFSYSFALADTHIHTQTLTYTVHSYRRLRLIRMCMNRSFVRSLVRNS